MSKEAKFLNSPTFQSLQNFNSESFIKDLNITTSTYDSKQQKDLIIFACYINVENRNNVSTREILNNFDRSFNEIIKEIEKQTNYFIKIFLFPIIVGNTKIECIFSGKQFNTDINFEDQFKQFFEDKSKILAKNAKKDIIKKVN